MDILLIATGPGVGAAVLHVITATRQVVASNTNLGMVLLLAPLAAVRVASLRERLRDVLKATTVQDAQFVYQAIRIADPGGLGTVAEQDVSDEPTVTLVEAMTLAADRDLVARQYANGYAEVFDIALPAVEATLQDGWSIETAIVAAHLKLLATVPDTLIVRKRGPDVAAEAMKLAVGVLEAGWPERAEGVREFDAFDRWLRSDGHARNPGATADLVAAALFAALRSGTIQLPLTLTAGKSPWPSSQE
jgi:triphosphoribosyl-dephospho-CoA synthase